MNENVIQEARQMFGLSFRDLRKEKKLSQEAVAAFCGVTKATINKVEQGKFAYSIDLMFKLSVVLGFTVTFEAKDTSEPSRYLLQASQREGFATVTDTECEVVCSFEVGRFNDTHTISFLNDTTYAPSKIASIVRELADWIQEYHGDMV